MSKALTAVDSKRSASGISATQLRREVASRARRYSCSISCGATAVKLSRGNNAETISCTVLFPLAPSPTRMSPLPNFGAWPRRATPIHSHNSCTLPSTSASPAKHCRSIASNWYGKAPDWYGKGSPKMLLWSGLWGLMTGVPSSSTVRKPFCMVTPWGASSKNRRRWRFDNASLRTAITVPARSTRGLSFREPSAFMPW